MQNKSAIIEVTKGLYTNVQTECHRRPGPWNEGRKSLMLSDLAQDSVPTVIADDPSAAIALGVARKKASQPIISTLVCSDTGIALSTSIAKIEEMKSHDDVNTIMSTTNQFAEFNFIGNNAFSITKPVLEHIVRNPPKTTRLVTESDPICFVPGHRSTKSWESIFSGLKDKTGLKAVYYLPDRFFKQYKADGSDGKSAQQITVVLHAEKGYQGSIEVYDRDENLVYIADRLAEFLPRTVEAWNISQLPTIGASWTGKPNVWNNVNGYGKNNEDQARQDLTSRMFEQDYRIVIPHQNPGTPGRPETWWADESLGLHTTGAESLDPRQFLEMQRYVMSFGNNRAQRDSMLSLMKTRYFAIAYQCMAPPAFGGPALEYLLSKFPADRIWDQQEVENYVRSNTSA
jgi:hypothetical protein